MSKLKIHSIDVIESCRILILLNLMEENLRKESLIDFLVKHCESHRVSFHMPGHKGKSLFEEFGYGEVLNNLANMDITEIPGSDNLFQPETVIKNLMDRYSDYYSNGCSADSSTDLSTSYSNEKRVDSYCVNES